MPGGLVGLEQIEREKKDRRQKRFHLAIMAVASGVLTLTTQFAYRYIRRRFPWVIDAHEGHVVVALIIVGCGIGAHYFKRAKQYWYGTLEVVVGVASVFGIAFSMSQKTLDLPRWASIIGAGYVIARGLNNMHDFKTNGYKAIAQKRRHEAMLKQMHLLSNDLREVRRKQSEKD